MPARRTQRPRTDFRNRGAGKAGVARSLLKRLGRFCSALALAFHPFSPATAQGLEITPTIVLMQPGQSASTLTITNREDHRISFQIRGYSWQQDSQGSDALAPSQDLVASPPIASIEPGASQLVRLILREPPQGHEGTYRILFDQLPPPHQAGLVRILLRLSIPVFAEPKIQVAPRLHWRIANEQGRSWLIVSNDGTRHLTLGGMTLHAQDGRELRLEIKSPPHILAGATRRWPILTQSPLAAGGAVRLTANADVGTIDERISPDAGP